MKHLSYLLFCLVLLWPGVRLCGQGQADAKTGDTIILNELRYRFDFSVVPGPGQVSPRFSRTLLDKTRIDSVSEALAQQLEPNPLELRDADLVLSLKVVGAGSDRRQVGYRITATLAAEPSRLGYAFEQRTVLSPGQKAGEIVWADALEKVLEFGPNYSITLTVDIFERVDFREDSPPNILVHALVAGIGGGILYGLGQDAHQKAERDYASYQSIWKDGGDRRTADPVLGSAEKQERNAVLLRNMGIGFLVGNAVWYYIRHRKYQRKNPRKNAVNQPLNPLGVSTSVRPLYDPVFGSVGLRLTYVF